VETRNTVLRLPGELERDRRPRPRSRWWRPVPDQPGVTPTEAMLTLTTCNPQVGQLPAPHRARQAGPQPGALRGPASRTAGVAMYAWIWRKLRSACPAS
jgi:hypothetical protein